MNNRITAKERNLLKGAIRRVFSRSDLRRKIADASKVEHADARRPRVKKWAYCAQCGQVVPAYLTEVDHIDPVVPIHMSFEHMNIDMFVDRLWCAETNLQTLCEACHDSKSQRERELRKPFKPKKHRRGQNK